MDPSVSAAAASSGKRVGVKRTPWVRDAAARRREAVQQQRQARRDLTAHARRLAGGDDRVDRADESEPESGDAMELVALAADGSAHKRKMKTREERIKRRREHYAQQLMVPEWMVDVPADLNGRGSATGGGWYVLPRPEGKRCLVVTSNGVTVARTQAGSILKKFPSALPNGSRKTAASGEAYCILDCIFHEHDHTFYVLDVMCWKGYLLYDCTTEFRLYWMRDKLDEGTAATVSSANPYRFLPIPCFECDEQGLETAYATPFPFLKDGLLFLLKAAHYEMGLSPLALVWKDAMTSRYFVFSDKPTIVLRFNAERQFVTLEGIVMWTPDEAFVEAHELTDGDLAKFCFENGFVGEITGLAFVARCSPQRALADSWTKILFQHGARNGGLPIDRILEATRSAITMESA